MRILWLNSKKCLGLSLILASTLAQGSSGTLGIKTQILSDLSARKSSNFASLIQSWQQKHGTRAIPHLLSIAGSTGTEDPDRYIALLGAAKLGGSGVEKDVVPFLKDKSWMLRTAALRALVAIETPSAGKSVLALLKDPALVVRMEAATAVARLRPQGSVAALLAAVRAPENYHQGIAQWVPQQAIRALVALKARDSAKELKTLLSHSRDPGLQKLTIAALGSLTGKTLKKGAPLSKQVEAWEAEKL